MPPAKIPKARRAKIRTSGYQARGSAFSTAFIAAQGGLLFSVFIRSENAERSFAYPGSCHLPPTEKGVDEFWAAPFDLDGLAAVESVFVF